MTSEHPGRSMAGVVDERGEVTDRVAGPGAVEVHAEDDVTRIVLTGEIDAEAEPELRRAVDTALGRQAPVEVMTGDVTFMDSTGVSFLAVLASRSGGTVAVVDPPEIVRFLIETTQITELVDVRGGV